MVARTRRNKPRPSEIAAEKLARGKTAEALRSIHEAEGSLSRIGLL